MIKLALIDSSLLVFCHFQFGPIETIDVVNFIVSYLYSSAAEEQE